MKQKKLYVRQVLDHDASSPQAGLVYMYRVHRVVNSVTPNIGMDLSEETLNNFCNQQDWTVTIDND